MHDVFVMMQQHLWFWMLTVTLVSLCVGSFLNVVIYRLPIMLKADWKAQCEDFINPEQLKEQNDSASFNLVIPHSHCPKCDTPIKPWQNIPLVSWLLLKGRCKACQTPISIRYPLIELLTACLSGFIAWHFGATAQALLYIFVTWALIALVFIDIDEMLLPDQITQPLLWLVLLASCFSFSITVAPHQAIIGAAVGYLSLWSVYWLFKLLTGKEGMGYGDFKLLAIFGALLGWEAILIIVLLSSLVGAIIGSIQLSIQGKDKSTPIPFGPYLAIAGWIVILYGDIIQATYFGLIL